MWNNIHFFRFVFSLQMEIAQTLARRRNAAEKKKRKGEMSVKMCAGAGR